MASVSYIPFNHPMILVLNLIPQLANGKEAKKSEEACQHNDVYPLKHNISTRPV